MIPTNRHADCVDRCQKGSCETGEFCKLNNEDTIMEKTASQQAYELCLEIEKLPAGEQQTKCSVLASDLMKRLALSESSASP